MTLSQNTKIKLISYYTL